MSEPAKANIPPKRVAVLANPQLAQASEMAQAITDRLTALDRSAFWGEINDEQVRQRMADEALDLAIALGGDGTMLRAGHLCAPLGIPVLGINMGRLGFLTEVQQDSWESALERVANGDYWIEERMMLQATHRRDSEMVGSWQVLNECFVGRGETVRPVDLDTEVDGRYITTFVADGLIAATATGSTAYALAAGGPILPPELRNILLVPVAPHLSVDRAVVLHEGSSVRVVVHTAHQAILSIDGGPPSPVQDGDSIEIRAGEHSARFARLQDPGYFYSNLTSWMNPLRANKGNRSRDAR
jgi:NAD+ kinase